ncbi:MAG: hypothetical protein HFH87_03130 [Lachnospiraceae bacterium]|nr:hypothetical protein [Lachnospiraceae bacterium]
MDEPVFLGELEIPRFIQEGYEYLGEDEQWHIRDDAPYWAKKEFEEFYAKIAHIPGEDGLIAQV